MSADEKVEIARHLSRMRVDVCEAGFPVASPGDFDAVVRIAKEVGGLMDGRGTDEGGTGKPMVKKRMILASSTLFIFIG